MWHGISRMLTLYTYVCWFISLGVELLVERRWPRPLFSAPKELAS